MTNIRSVANGYLVEYNGEEYIAKTLVEAATLCGELSSSSTEYIRYAPGKCITDLTQISVLWRDGMKISAIKELRACFTPTFNLREAKELLEALYN